MFVRLWLCVLSTCPQPRVPRPVDATALASSGYASPGCSASVDFSGRLGRPRRLHLHFHPRAGAMHHGRWPLADKTDSFVQGHVVGARN